MFKTARVTFIIPCFRHPSRFEWLLYLALLVTAGLFSSGVIANTADSVQHIERAQISQLTPLVEEKPPVWVNLPHSWNSERPQRFGTFNYSVDVTLTEQQLGAPLAVYLPRLGNRYEVSVNDQLVHSSGDLRNQFEAYTHSPMFAELPVALLKVGTNTLRLKVVGESGRFAGVSSIYIGDAVTLKKNYDSRVFFHSLSTLVIVISCILIGILSFIFSYFLRNKNHFILGLAASTWALSHSYLLVHKLAFDYRIGLFFYDFFYACGVAFLLLSITFVIRFKKRWYQHTIYIFIGFSFILSFTYYAGSPMARSVFLNMMLALALFTFLLYLRIFFTSRREKSWLMFTMLAVSIAFGIYDQVIVYQYKNGFEILALTRYAFLLCALAVATVMASQLLRINSFIKQSHLRTRRKLSDNQTRLTIAFSNKMQIQSELIVEKERWRMMQDMHDGLGSQLIGLQHAVKNPNADPQMLGNMVRSSIEELRMNINSLGQQHSHISSMLGALRERLELMIQQQGKTLEWAVAHTPEISSINHAVIHQVEKMVLEVFTNIAKHSDATKIKLDAVYLENGCVCVTIKENGKGYDVSRISSPASKGLVGLYDRAKSIGAKLSINENGCEIKINIPTKDEH